MWVVYVCESVCGGCAGGVCVGGGGYVGGWGGWGRCVEVWRVCGYMPYGVCMVCVLGVCVWKCVWGVCGL